MAKYIPYDPDETQLIPINFKAQLQPGSFEYALNDLVENKLDLIGFASLYKNDEEGRPAYNVNIQLTHSTHNRLLKIFQPFFIHSPRQE